MSVLTWWSEINGWFVVALADVIAVVVLSTTANDTKYFYIEI